MRILLTIHHSLDRNSGAPGAALALADAMRIAGHDVHLLSHDNLPRWARGRLALFCFPVLVMWHAMRGRRSYDVLDYLSCDGWLATFLPRSWRPAVLAMHSQGLEHLVHERMLEEIKRGHGVAPSWKYWLYRGSVHLWTVERAIRGADVAFLLNRFEASFVCDLPRKWKTRDQVILTFNGASDEIIGACPSHEPATDSALGIAFIGTFIERKGIAYLTPALEAHLRKYLTSRFVLLGTAQPEDQILRVFSPDVRGRVTVVPSYERKDLSRLLSQSHVLVLPSLCEGFSLAFIEAMTIGLVPVVTRGHGFEEAVVDGSSGILIDRGSSEQIVAALERLENDRRSWHRMRENAIAVSQAFTWTRAAAIRIEGYSRAQATPSDGCVRSGNVNVANPSRDELTAVIRR